MGEFQSLKKLLSFFILIPLISLIASCAKPTVVEVTTPEDENMTCIELENSVAEAQKFKRDALFEKDGTGANYARLMLFWPAMATTYHNADKAIRAANDRTFHLVKKMKEKNCEGIDLVNAEIIRSSTETLVGQLQTLRDMYKNGDITKEEYFKAKRKILD